jgi:hypothetical protein
MLPHQKKEWEVLVQVVSSILIIVGYAIKVLSVLLTALSIVAWWNDKTENAIYLLLLVLVLYTVFMP